MVGFYTFFQVVMIMAEKFTNIFSLSYHQKNVGVTGEKLLYQIFLTTQDENKFKKKNHMLDCSYIGMSSIL